MRFSVTTKKVTKITYAILVHLFVIILLFKTDAWNSFSAYFSDTSPARDYQIRVAHQIRVARNLVPDQWLFLGDSMIEGLNVSAIRPNAVNFGIGHDRVAWLIDRIALYDKQIYNTTWVVGVGVNDIDHQSPDTLVKSMEQWLDSLPSEQRIFLLGALPIAASRREDADEFNEKVHRYNEWLMQLANKHDARYYIAPPTKLLEGDFLLESVHDRDGLHLNQAGYTIWIEHLRDALKPY